MRSVGRLTDIRSVEASLSCAIYLSVANLCDRWASLSRWVRRSVCHAIDRAACRGRLGDQSVMRSVGLLRFVRLLGPSLICAAYSSVIELCDLYVAQSQPCEIGGSVSRGRLNDRSVRPSVGQSVIRSVGGAIGR